MSVSDMGIRGDMSVMGLRFPCNFRVEKPLESKLFSAHGKIATLN